MSNKGSRKGTDMSEDENIKAIEKDLQEISEGKVSPEKLAAIDFEIARTEAMDLLSSLPGSFEKLSDEDIKIYLSFCDGLNLGRREIFLDSLLRAKTEAEKEVNRIKMEQIGQEHKRIKTEFLIGRIKIKQTLN